MPKLDLYLAALKNRYEERPELFCALRATLKSGRTEISAALRPGKEGLMGSILGKKEPMDFASFCRALSDAAEKYEEGALFYEEKEETRRARWNRKGMTILPVEKKTAAPDAAASAVLPDREYYLKIDEAGPLLRTIGILTPEGKLKNDKIRKYNQIDHFIEILADDLKKTPADEMLTFLDCACGKSYLSFALNHYLTKVLGRRVKMIGVDISERVIEESRRMAGELGYGNMEFVKADLSDYRPPRRVYGVISLHACDIATDLALYTALKAEARLIACVPCCHKELLDQFKLPLLSPITRHGILKARLNDTLSDGLRVLKLEACGYRVKTLEYISPLDTPKNLLILARREREVNPEAAAEYESLTKALSVTPALARFLENDRLFSS